MVMVMYYGYSHDLERTGFCANPPVVEQAEAGRGLEVPRPSYQRADLREKEDTKVDVRIQPPSAQFHGQGRGRVSRALATLSTAVPR